MLIDNCSIAQQIMSPWKMFSRSNI